MTGLAGLVAYQVALEFAQKVYELEVKGSLRDQITRAAESVVLNIAEAHPAKGADRARRFRIAASEASECRGALALLKIRKRISAEKYDEMWNLVDQIGAMLYRLGRPG